MLVTRSAWLVCLRCGDQWDNADAKVSQVYNACLPAPMQVVIYLKLSGLLGDKSGF